MYRNIVSIMLVMIGVIHAEIACAYDWKAHMSLARISAERSIMSDNKFMDDIGFDELAQVYYEMHKEQCSSLTHKNNYIEFIYCGAMQEDLSIRPLNHFYDPVNDIALDPDRNGNPVMGANPTPSWALEDRGDLSSTFFITIEQENSLKHAYDYFYKSLSERSKVTRDENEYKLFKSLGMVVHLLHDMAQPEHVRNDQHLPAYYFRSKYEGYMEEEARKINYSQYNYDRIQFDWFYTARKLWEDDLLDSIGLSEFTNRNFVSNDSNFAVKPGGIFSPGPHYALPIPIERDESEIFNKEQASNVLNNPALDGEIWFVSTEVHDEYMKIVHPGAGNNIDINTRASALNLFAHDLNPIKKILQNNRVFGVNDATFEAAREFLLPRAISYGTGLFDYFFRGHIDVEDVSVSKEFASVVEVRLTVRNTTSRDNPGGEAFVFDEGAFKLYYDYGTAGSRREASLARNSPSSADVTFGMNDQDTKDFIFEIPVGAQWDRSKPLTLIFDGIIGFERGIAVKVFCPDPLIAFNVNGIEGASPVDNIVNIYKSYDLGYSWDISGSVYFPITDNTLAPENRLKVLNSVNLGDGEILAFVEYTDYIQSDGSPGLNESWSSVIRSDDYGHTWIEVDFDWSTLLEGSSGIHDNYQIIKSISFTGDTGLAALRVQHPDSDVDPPLTPRKFQLFNSATLGSNGSWTGSSGLGTGGLPELDYLGGSSYVFTAALGDQEGADRHTTDSIMSRTDDGGGSYHLLTEIEQACVEPTTAICEQHLLNFGDDRLLRWTLTRHYNIEDFTSYLLFYLSQDGGSSWLPLASAPFTQICQSYTVYMGNVKDLLYIGKSQKHDDTLLARTECLEVSEDQSGTTQFGPITGEGLFVTSNGGKNWHEVNLPPGHNRDGIFLYLGDNGAIPGLYRPEN
ncbi:MAG: hypothetical protein KME61_02985 [Candidatus Thiodiazotropha sp. (ex Ctena orbiculata)]|nr:hypothetical protein [Candidatus Thiodiazotropha taylori]